MINRSCGPHVRARTQDIGKRTSAMLLCASPPLTPSVSDCSGRRHSRNSSVPLPCWLHTKNRVVKEKPCALSCLSTWHWSRPRARYVLGCLGSTRASLRGEAGPIQSQHEAFVLRQLAPLRCAQLRDASTAPTWVAETPASHRRPPNHTSRGSLHHRRWPNRAAANPRGKLDKCRPSGRVAGCLTRAAQPHFSSRWSAAAGACAAPVPPRYLRQRRWPVST